MLGSLQAIAAAKAELIAGLQAGATVVIPAGEPLLAPYLREDVQTVTFGDGGDVALAQAGGDGRVLIAAHGETIELRPSFAQAHNLRNLLAASRGGAGARRRPGGRARGPLLGAARRATSTLSGGVVADQRLLQRQPDVDARGDRRPRRDGAGAARRGARRHARARARRRRGCTAKLGCTRQTRASTC